MLGQPGLLVATALAIAVLIVLIARARWHPFIALAVVSLALGIVASVPPALAVRAFQDGLGATLASTAGVISLGAMMGKLLAISGGAETLTARVVALTGPRRIPWAFAAAGFIVGLPVFFSVGFVVLMPLAAAGAVVAGVPFVVAALPLAAGLSSAHGLTPPHPGPLAAIERLHADPGLVLLYGALAAIPATVLAGPVFARLVAGRVQLVPGSLLTTSAKADRPPGAGITLAVLLLPVMLMLTATAATAWLPAGTGATWIAVVGQPLVAMLAAVLVAAAVFGLRRGLRGRDVLAVCEEALAPVASILLVVGGGGGLGRVLDVAGVDDAIVAAAGSWHLSPIVLGWLAAVLLRVSVGSATVAITTAAGLVGPLADAAPGTNRELLVVAMGAGSLAASHVNDGGFWLVKEYLNASVAETLATWTVLETVIAVVGLAAVLVLDLVV
jgi:GntP family gluconate:H+ symporter